MKNVTNRKQLATVRSGLKKVKASVFEKKPNAPAIEKKVSTEEGHLIK